MSETLQTTPSCACSRRPTPGCRAPPISSTVYRHPEVKRRLTSRGHQDGSRLTCHRASKLSLPSPSTAVKSANQASSSSRFRSGGTTPPLPPCPLRSLVLHDLFI